MNILDIIFQTENAQHSVHPTGGSLRVFRQFSWLGVGSVKTALSQPAHQRVTQTVRQPLAAVSARKDKQTGAIITAELKKGNMHSKTSNWLLAQDEKFLSIIKDERKRTEHLDRLLRYRAFCVVLLFLFAILFIIAVFAEVQGSSIALVLFMIVSQIFSYLDSDSKIRDIRLYELLRTESEKP